MSAPPGYCAWCRARPVSPGYPYCGRHCARTAASGGGAGSPQGVVAPAALAPALVPYPMQAAAPVPQPAVMPVQYLPVAATAPVAYTMPAAAPYSPQPTAFPVQSQPAQASWVGGVPSGGATQPAVHLTAPTQAITATYSVRFPFNPQGWGMSVNADLSIGTVTPGGIEDHAGVRCEPPSSLLHYGINLEKYHSVRA
jgi:hypothetical protein